jgi:hypothetical protein
LQKKQKTMVTLNFFEKRPVMDNIGFSIKFIQQNFTHLFKTLIVIYLPMYFLLGVLYLIDAQWFGIVTGGWYAWLVQIVRSEIYENVQINFAVPYMIVSLAYQAISGACISSAFYSYFILHSKKGINFDAKELLSEMGKNIWSLMSLNAIITIVLFVAIFFFTRIVMLSRLAESNAISYLIAFTTLAIIIYFLIRMLFLQILTVTEETNLISGVERSVELVENNWWNVFGVMLANFVILVLMVFVLIMLPTYILTETKLLNRDTMQGFTIFLTLFGLIFQFLATIYWKVCLFSVYGTLYEGKEHKNLYQSINKLGVKEKEEDNEDF